MIKPSSPSRIAISILLLGFVFLLQGCQTQAPTEGPTPQPYHTLSTPLQSSSALLKLSKEYISGSMAQGEFRYKLYVTALSSAGNVKIKERIPEGVQFLKSNPQAIQKKDKVYILLGDMDEGETKTVDLVYSAITEGVYNVCSIVSGEPMICVPLLAGLPQLSLTKEGPETAELGDIVEWTVMVKNTGSATASVVRFEDVLSEGFKAISPQSYDLGDLSPGQGKKITIQAEAIRSGVFTNVAKIMMDSGQVVEASSVTNVVEPRVSITNAGPEEAYVFVPAGYTIVVRNEGETSLHNLIIKDYIPEYAEVVDAGGGLIQAGAITWEVNTLEPGHKIAFNVRLIGNRPGVTANKATVVADNKLHEEAVMDTKWVVAPRLQTSLENSKDSLQVEDTTIYTAEIRNQDELRPITVNARISFSEELSIVGIQSIIKGKMINNGIDFQNLNLEPEKSIIIKVKAKGARAGVGLAVMQLSADFLPKINITQETTTIY